MAGNEALTTYSRAQRRAKLLQNAYLKPPAAYMRRALGRGRKLTPEEAAQRTADRAAKAAAKLREEGGEAVAAGFDVHARRPE